MEPALGQLSVTFVGAEYEEAYLEGPPSGSYCVAWLLEKVRWRRRKCRPRGLGPGEEPLRPAWGDEFVFDDVRDDAKVAVDVWGVRDGDEPDEFFGKVTVVLADAMRAPVTAWHELLPGRVQIELRWTPLVEGGPAGPPVVPQCRTCHSNTGGAAAIRTHRGCGPVTPHTRAHAHSD